MEPKKESREGEQKRAKKWKFKLIAVIFILLILVGILFLPTYLSSEKGRQTILAKINESIDGKADFSSISIGWLKGIKITDLSFRDDSGQTTIAVKQITTKPHYGSIFTGSLSFGETIIDEPVVEINFKDQQKQNQKNSSSKQKAPADKNSSGNKKAQIGIALPVKRINLVVKNGSFKVTNAQAGTVELSRISTRLNLQPPGQQTSFDMNLVVVDRGNESKIQVSGQIKGEQKKGWSLQGTSGELSIEVDELNLESLGPVFALAGIEVQAEGMISVDLKSKVENGLLKDVIGSFKGENLDVTGAVLKGDKLKSSRFDIDVKLSTTEELVTIDELRIDSDWAQVTASGVVPTTIKSLAQFMQADSPYSLKSDFQCDLGKVMSQMPHIFGVKEDMNITSGQLSGNVETAIRNGKKVIQGQAVLVGLGSTVGAKTVVLSEPVSVAMEITSDKDEIRFDKLNLSSAFCKIDCTGTSKSLKYNAEMDLEKLQNELGQFVDIGQYQMAGKFFSKGEVTNNENKVAAVGSSTIRNFRLTSSEGVSAFEPKVDLTFSFAADKKEQIVDIDFVNVNTSLGQVSLKDSVLPLGEDAAEPMELTISTSVDLQKLRPFAILLASLPKETAISGSAESQIFISSKNDVYFITTEATGIKNFKISSSGQVPFEQDQVLLFFDAEINPAQKAVIFKKLRLISPQIRIEGNFQQVNEGKQTKVEGQIDCKYDWAALSAVVAPFLPAGLKMEGEREDSINFASYYPIDQKDGLLANLNMEGKFGFEKAEYMGLNFGPTELEPQFQNGLLTIPKFTTTVNNGQLSFAGQADFKQKPSMLKITEPIQIVKDVQINDEMSKQLLTYVNPIFAKALNVSGVANFNCESLVIPLAGANQNDLEVIGTISLSQVRLQASDLLGKILSAGGDSLGGKDITVHPTRFVLKDGFLRYDNMQIDVGRNPINFAGVIGLDKSLNMKVKLPYTLDGRTVRTDKETTGERITLPLRGTVDEPEIDLGNLFQDQLKKRLEEELLKGLEGLFR